MKGRSTPNIKNGAYEVQIECNFRKKAKLQQKRRTKNRIEETHSCLVKTILQAAEKTIPRDEEKITSSMVEQKIVRTEYRKYCKDPKNTTKLRSFQHRRAIKKRVFRKAKRNTPNKFVNSLNFRTPNKVVRDKFRKVNWN